MLKLLTINNLAIIDELALEFNNGLTVFTGETGAGKSITLDALGLILGDRADTSVIRSGTHQAEVSAVFNVSDKKKIRTILDEQAIEIEDEEIIIRRVVQQDGRSRAFINNKPVTVQLLKDLGEHIVHIHGQHAHQLLGQKDNQRILLDQFGSYPREIEDVSRLCKDWSEANNMLNEIRQGKDQDATINLLRYQVEEIDALDLKEGEYKELDEEHRRLSNSRSLLDTAQSALNGLRDDEQSISLMITSLLASLREVEKFDEHLQSINQLLDSASIQLDEAADELRHYLDDLEMDPERLGNVEDRIGKIHDIARKHHVKPEELDEYYLKLKERLAEIENNEGLLIKLEKKQAETLAGYRSAATSLHKKRSEAAKYLEKDVTKQIKNLGMPDGQFTVEIVSNELDIPRINGMDSIEFLVSLNPGQSTQALRKVASGGELSRISLAIQVVSSTDKSGTALVFDEVDAGIGGGVAEIVGKLLHELSENHQILCVTHLPQVASQADHHFQVIKIAEKRQTSTSIKELNKEERVDEIARMLGGMKITEKTRKHADEMLRNV